jgi:hypothetical protein
VHCVASAGVERASIANWGGVAGFRTCTPRGGWVFNQHAKSTFVSRRRLMGMRLRKLLSRWIKIQRLRMDDPDVGGGCWLVLGGLDLL